MVLAMGVLYSELFHMEMANYLPYLALSLVLWNTLGGMVGDACTCFTASEGTIRSIRMPFTIHAGADGDPQHAGAAAQRGGDRRRVRLVSRLARVPPPSSPCRASLLWFVDSLAACLLLGAFCARFRDVAPIVGSIMQIAFFLTPIIWKPELIDGNAVYLVFNPFYPLLALVRDPLLGQVPDSEVWIAAGVWSGLLIAASWLLFARVRGRLAFWV